MRVDRAREAALDALAACRRNGAWIDGALKQVLKRDGLSGRDAAFASRIAYGVMQNRIYLDRCLARCLTQRPEKLEPLLLDILRIGAYQILFMDKVPVNAAVNEAVEMAKAHKLSRAAGLVNAVLRNVDRKRGEPLAFADELEALSVQTSHPRALVERMVGLLGAEEAEAFLRADNEPVPTTIQTNTLKTTQDFTHNTALHCVRLKDDQSALNHLVFFFIKIDICRRHGLLFSFGLFLDFLVCHSFLLPEGSHFFQL